MAVRSIIRLLPGLTLLAGLTFTAVAWQAARAREQRLLNARFQAEAEQVARAVGWEMNLFSEVLSSLGPLHALSDRVTAYDFEEFARKGLTHQKSVLGAFGFAQWIPDAMRAALEAPDTEGGSGRPLTEYDETNNLRPAGQRPAYFPITYQYPASGLQLPDGFDLASLPAAPSAIARMVVSGQPALGPATGGYLRRTEAGDGMDGQARTQPGYFIFAPIFGDDRALSGFTTAILWPQDLLRRALERTVARRVQVTLFDPAAGRPAWEGTALRREYPVALADVPWLLRCEALPAYLATHATPLPWLALGAGLLVTLLLTWQTGGLVQRAARIEATVRERTMELQEANARLAEEMRERSRLEVEIEEIAEREKRRIGHDLHDSLGQKLTGAVYLSKALAGSLEAGDARNSAEKINDILKDAVAEVRRTARGLAPVEVGEGGLAQALHRLAEDICSVYGIACAFRSTGTPALRDARMATQLYHIAQEAVTNAIRHGAAREIDLTLSADDAGGRLVIRDRGRGWDQRAENSEGAGLRIMRHRAASAGIRLQVESTPGAGATVTCSF